MDNAIYALLNRQRGLAKELNVIANNIANASTNGFKKEGAVFSEYIKKLDGGDPSISIGQLDAHYTDFKPGVIRTTGSPFDLAIDGDGFFLIETEDGVKLSRDGHFVISNDGVLVNSEGYPVLDGSETQIQVPTDIGDIAIARDGTISAGGEPVGRIGLAITTPENMERIGGNLWTAHEGYVVDERSSILQGFIEGSNVRPVEEMARLIEVQRFYEMGQSILEHEDERIKKVVETLRHEP